MSNTIYTYWIFYIKEEFIDKIPDVVSIKLNRYIYAYTDKKRYAKEFRRIHSKNAIIMKKVQLSRDGVRFLAQECQNNTIRKYELTTKDDKFNITKIKLCMTEREFMISENTCYSHVEDIWKYVWDSNDCFENKYKRALDYLAYTRLFNKLNDGDTYYFPDMEADILGSFIHNFKSILTIGDE